MIVYKKTKQEFIEDTLGDSIEDIIKNAVYLSLHKSVGKSEYISWKNSLMYMLKVLHSDDIPLDVIVSIEYNIPRTNNRIDFIVTGLNDEDKEQLVLIELKQWTAVEKTDKDATVRTSFKHGISDTVHPCYQAWSYKNLMEGFNVYVYNGNVSIHPCVYMHNYIDDNIITNVFYQEYIDKAPIFFKKDIKKLTSYIASKISKGDSTDILSKVDNSEIRPSKSLVNNLSSMLKGNEEFTLIDKQKVIYETALELTKKSSVEKKNVLIVHGGPGTGKSVIAINLLVKLTQQGLISQYVTKNSAPRQVYEKKLTGTFKKTEISNFFSGSGAYTKTLPNSYDALIVDEAHRLNEKSGIFQNMGENQIKEIIYSSKFSVFFLDENQKVTLSDIGSEEQILKWAQLYNADVEILELKSQFRCSGSDGYLSWLDNVLQIKDTANIMLDKSEYDFQIVDDPSTLRDMIFEKNKETNSARLLAGYCWKWISKKDVNASDIVFPEYNFAMQWNLGSDGMLWIIKPESVSEIGCIHTCQGLELDYVGVIIGADIICVDGQVLVDPSKRATTDRSIYGYKKLMKENPELTKEKLRNIIKNTYRTLLTRGMKGCYVYFEDKELEKYFKSHIK
jgi:hypothetical protein